MDESKKGQFPRVDGRGKKIECLTGRCGASAMRTAIHGIALLLLLVEASSGFLLVGKSRTSGNQLPYMVTFPRQRLKDQIPGKKTATGSPSWDSAFRDGLSILKLRIESLHGSTRGGIEF